MNFRDQYINIGRSAAWDNRSLCKIPVYCDDIHPDVILYNLGIKGNNKTPNQIMYHIFHYTYLKFLRDAPDDTYEFILERWPNRKVYTISFYIRKINDKFELIDAFSNRPLALYKVKGNLNYRLIDITGCDY